MSDSYDTPRHLGSITSANGAEPTTSNTFAYDGYGRLASSTAGNGVVTSYAYTSGEQVASINHQTSTGADLLTLNYQFNGAGNRSDRTETGVAAVPDEHYTYSAGDHLTQVDGDPTPVYESFTYDPAGNRTGDVSGTTYTYDSLMNRLTGMGTATFTYDANGNRTSKSDSGATATYTWDTQNKLIGVGFTPSGDSVSYRYDALGRRIERVDTVIGSGTTTDTWLYDDQNVIAQNRNAALYQEYLHRGGLDTPIALVDHSAGTAAHYYHTDSLGSVRGLTDSTETLSQSYTYAAFGSTTANVPTGPDQPFRYTAREWDDAVGLYYYRARYYDEQAGRFLNHDPVAYLTDKHLYAYTVNNPHNALDPTGEVVIIIVPGGKLPPCPTGWSLDKVTYRAKDCSCTCTVVCFEGEKVIGIAFFVVKASGGNCFSPCWEGLEELTGGGTA